MMSFAERRALLVLKRTTNRSQSQRLTTLYWPQVTPMQESSSRAPQLPAQLASPSTNGTLFLVRTKMVSFKHDILIDSYVHFDSTLSYRALLLLTHHFQKSPSQD
ncbi:hypothetical protein M8J77_003293 [Diaphorina citri]|nr:hypothetical protein M8J77_003293 [Diaphorina citri]